LNLRSLGDIGVVSAIRFLLQRFLVILRTLLLGGGGLLLLFGSDAVGFAGAGPLGCVIAAFVASSGWRAQGWTDETVSLDSLDCYDLDLNKHMDKPGMYKVIQNYCRGHTQYTPDATQCDFFYDVTSRIRFMFLVFPQVSRK